MSFANLKTIFYGNGYRRYRFYLIPFSVFRRGYLQPERIPVRPYRQRCGKQDISLRIKQSFPFIHLREK